MSVIPLVQIEKKDFERKDISLRQENQKVADFGEDFQRIVDDLIDTFWSHPIAVGLAAPQIGIQVKLAVINFQRDKTIPMLILVNPEIVSTSGKKDKKRESCMSLPHYAGIVERRDKVSLNFQDRYGEIQYLETQGFLSRVIQHEIDHIEGILYVDRMEDILKLEKTDIFKYN
jgi:peptide deformylase